MLHGPGSVRAGTRDGDNALAGLISYAAEVEASHVVYHAANLPDVPASEDRRLAETRSLAALATRAERLGVIIALENLAPVYPGPDALSFTPMILRTMAKRISSPAVGALHRRRPREHRRPASPHRPAGADRAGLDRAVLFHLHDNLGARRGESGLARRSIRCGSTSICPRAAGRSLGRAWRPCWPARSAPRCFSKYIRHARRPRASSPARLMLSRRPP